MAHFVPDCFRNRLGSRDELRVCRDNVHERTQDITLPEAIQKCFAQFDVREFLRLNSLMDQATQNLRVSPNEKSRLVCGKANKKYTSNRSWHG
jgi:hypothetical protein